MDRETKEIINNYLNEIKGGNRASIDLLYDKISSSIRHIALKYLKDDFNTDDLVQDFWEDIFVISLGFNFMQNGFSYLCKIMTRRAINRYNQINHEKCKQVPYVDYDATDEHIDQSYGNEPVVDALIANEESLELGRVIDKAISKLPETEKIIVQLIYFEDKTIREIAKVLKISKSQVGRLKIKAIEKLKSEINSFLGDKSGV